MNSININEALGDLRRPLHLGDTLQHANGIAYKVSWISKNGSDVCLEGCRGVYNVNEFRRVDPPTSEVDDVSELRRQLAEAKDAANAMSNDLTHIGEQLDDVTRERDELLRKQNDTIEHGEVPEYGTRDYEQFDSGITWTLRTLARQVEVEFFDHADGSETLEGDVSGTIYNILDKAKLYSKETGKFATELLDQAERERDEALAAVETMSQAYADQNIQHSKERDELRTNLAAAEAERRPTDPESSHDLVKWIVSDIGELGVSVKDCTGKERQLYLYKGGSIEYGNDGDEQRTFRPVSKREFGEVCHPVDYYMVINIDPTRAENWLLETSPELRQQIVDVVEGRRDNGHHVGSLQRQLKRKDRQIADEREFAKQREADSAAMREAMRYAGMGEPRHFNRIMLAIDAMQAKGTNGDDWDFWRAVRDKFNAAYNLTAGSELLDRMKKLESENADWRRLHEALLLRYTNVSVQDDYDGSVAMQVSESLGLKLLQNEMDIAEQKQAIDRNAKELAISHEAYEKLDHECERIRLKCRTAKAALVEHYRGKIDPSRFGEVEPIYWKCNLDSCCCNGVACYKSERGQIRFYNPVLGAWIALSKTTSELDAMYPRCNADGTPLAKSDDDADLLRKLWELLSKSGIVQHANQPDGVTIYTPTHTAATELHQLLFAIRDGGAE